MKAKIEWSPGEVFQLTAYEKGDEPAEAVDLSPDLINAYQQAEYARQHAIEMILAHLRLTNQEFVR